MNMPLNKKKCALILKLFYQNENNISAVLCAYRCMKNLKREPMSVNEVKCIIRNFKKISFFKVTNLGRGYKWMCTDYRISAYLTNRRYSFSLRWYLNTELPHMGFQKFSCRVTTATTFPVFHCWMCIHDKFYFGPVFFWRSHNEQVR